MESNGTALGHVNGDEGHLCDLFDNMSVGTKAIHAGYDSAHVTSGAVIPPLYMATTYDRSSQQDYLYSRLGNPNREIVEKKLASLEGTKYGKAFGSGMAAVNALVSATCTAGDHVIVGPNMYGGAIAYFSSVAPAHGINVTWLDVGDPVAVRDAVRPNTKIVWIEVLTNPLLMMTDVRAVSDAIKAAAGQNTAPLLVVDNTFLTPYWMNPLEFGADVVLHSATKYLNGHSDALLGAVLCSDADLDRKLRWMQEVLGGVPSPFDCNMVIRGLKTFHVRMQRHQETSLQLATFLESHPCVSRVFHPGLPSYAYKKLAEKQCRGYPGMLSFLVTGSLEQARHFLRNLKVAANATSLGGAETLVGLPNDTLANTLKTAGAVPEWAKYPALIRASVGLEDVEDLIADFDQALRRAIPVNE